MPPHQRQIGLQGSAIPAMRTASIGAGGGASGSSACRASGASATMRPGRWPASIRRQMVRSRSTCSAG